MRRFYMCSCCSSVTIIFLVCAPVHLVDSIGVVIWFYALLMFARHVPDGCIAYFLFSRNRMQWSELVVIRFTARLYNSGDDSCPDVMCAICRIFYMFV